MKKMKKAQILETEKEEILNKHNDFKKILEEEKSKLNRGLLMSEQLSTGITKDPVLVAAETAGCIGNGQHFNYGTRPAYYILAKNSKDGRYNAGDKLVIYGDYTYEVFPKDGTQRKKYTWTCPNINKASQEQAAGEAAKTQAKTQLTLDEYKNQYGAQEFKELQYKTKADDPNFYKKVPFKGVETDFLYIPVYKKEFVATDINLFPAGSPQREYLEKLKELGYIISPSPLEKTNLRAVDLTQKAQGLFPNGLVVYLPKVAAGKVSDCRQYINQYFNNFVNDTPGDTVEFNKLKEQVMACKRAYYPNRWGGLGLVGNKLDQMIALLSRQSDNYNGVGMPTQDSEFVLK